MALTDKSFLQAGGRWFDKDKLPPAFWLTAATAIELGLHKQIAALGATPQDGGLLLPRQGRLVYEIALLAEQPRGTSVVAVVHSTSADEGRSWAPLAVTTDAQIYQLGKTLEAQGCAARLLK